MEKFPDKLTDVMYCKTDEEVCQFLSEQAKKYNLNIVQHWLVPYEGGIKVFYQTF